MSTTKDQIWKKVKELEDRLAEVEEKRTRIEEELMSLPNGHLESKSINGRVYYYLRYWEEGKLKSKYLGRDATKVKEQVQRASDLKRELTILKEEERRLRKTLERITLALSGQ
ncbi:hypothetical protein [Metallosphaera hakonensis]|uniref:DUF6788 domain-containing protein n=1 Tax=Metallosphaera hakonensis JCM 8857 = DSM 7519 TaxID=1293036 RepID=A0A2U9IS99_9CREN|nr:hypothetical protein [Metallosphaera hakonensis]AWR98874.1 hypothetical protein DFR87_03255 [Metallosphaera hakonensis JCM 8857 = DSM 7519]